MFLRFVCARTIEGLNARAGLFDAAYDLRERSDLEPSARDRLDAELEWFRSHLPVPSRLNRSRSKGYYRRRVTHGLSWFKSTADAHLARAFDLAALLTEHGYPIEVIKSRSPGYLVYEDSVQIVAEPFADTPTG
jgi:hypothetical protein